MKENLIQYVNLLFTGAADAAEIKQEILQNTLDRYDDLISQGKSPEAAYRLAISGIGDISEILGSTAQVTQSTPPSASVETGSTTVRLPSRILRAVAVALYILSPTPLFVLSEMGMDTIGLCGTIAICAVATVLMMLTKGPEPVQKKVTAGTSSAPQQALQKSVRAVVFAVGFAVYVILSFTTNAWFVTWLVFPIIAAVQGLVRAILDLKEVSTYEA